MVKAWWLCVGLVCACSGSNDKTDEPLPAAAWLSVTLSEPDGEPTCVDARPTPYVVGSEDAPVSGKTTVSCGIASNGGDPWFQGALTGTTNDGVTVHLLISNGDGLLLEYQSGHTGDLGIDAARDASCAPAFTAIVGDAVEADFDCALVPDINDPTQGCGLRGTVNFENCGMH